MNNKSTNLDKFIVNKLSEIEPDEKQHQRTNPWNHSVNLIIWGFIISSISIDIIHIQHFLLSLGIGLIYAGFRSLRNENRWFRIAWKMSILMIIAQLVALAYDSYPSALNGEDYFYGQSNFYISGFFLIFRVSLILVFRHSIRQVFLENNVVPKKGTLLLAAICMAVVGIFPFIPILEGEALYWLLPIIGLLILLAVMLRTLFYVDEALEQVGYCMTNAPVRFGGITIATALMVTSFLLVASICTATNHIGLEAEAIKDLPKGKNVAMLESMGVPKEILNDMTEESINSLNQTVAINVVTETMVFHPGYTFVQVDDNQTQFAPKPGKTNMQVTTIFFELPDHQVAILNYFQWIKGKAYWNDGFDTFYQSPERLVEGRLLYTKNNVEYAAPIPRLTVGKLMVQRDMDMGYDNMSAIYGGVSYPFSSENQRGYVLYVVDSETPETAWSYFSYIHFENPLRLPNFPPEQILLNGPGSRITLNTSNDPALQ